MLFYNALIFTPEGYVRGGFQVEEGRFVEIICGKINGEGQDLGGARILPGLIDIHTHGAVGADFSDGCLTGLVRMGKYLAGHGITSFAPASMTLPYETLNTAYQTAKMLRDCRPEGCARIAGIHMEGPFFSEKKKGAQNAAYLRDPDFEAFSKLYRECGGLIRIVDVAPELPGAALFTEQAKDLCTVSVAHTAADYDQAQAVFEAGASHLTHLFNAMPPIHHRRPGVIGAASERETVCAELICDGLHVHPSAVRMAFRLFGNRICLISDSLRCCGMPDGEYELGGQKVYLSGGVARLEDGTIAGSATNLFECMRNAVRFGISEYDAIMAATALPAKEIGDDEAGMIAEGRLADFLVCDEELNLKQVYMGGVRLKTEKY